MKDKNSNFGNAMVTFFVTYAKKNDVELEHFLIESTMFQGEPQNADGTVISMKIKEIVPVQKGNLDKSATIKIKDEGSKKPKEDKLDRYMHFSFHGAKFCIDREDMTVRCDKKPKLGEETGEHKNGLYSLNVETSN